MANHGLRRALADAGLTVRDLAQRVGVDEKTVSRWVAEDDRIPHQRHRWAASDALGVDEMDLWPEAVRRTVKLGPDREIVAAYPTRADLPKSVWRQLIDGARREITFAGYTNYFLWLEQPNLGRTLRRKAESGVRVRFIVGDPESEVTRHRETVENVPLTVSTRIRITLDELAKLDGVRGIETRLSDRHIACSVFVFDDQAIICQHLAAHVGHDSPTLHLRRLGDSGLWAAYQQHAEWLWDFGAPLPG